MKKTIRLCLISILFLLQANCPLPVSARQQSIAHPVNNQPADNQAVPDEEAIPSGEVVIDGNPILKVYEPVATLTPGARAQGIEMRIIAFARDSIPSESIRLQPRDAWIEIVAGNTMIMAITDGDARATGKTRLQLALEDAQNIRQAVEAYRYNHSWRMILRGILKTALVTLILVVALWLVRRLRLLFRSRIERQIHISANLEKKSAWHLSVAYLGPVMLAVGTILRWVLILALLEAYLTVTLGFYPSTREISVTSYLIRLIRLVFNQISKGDLKIPGFYPDWAKPTDKLIRALVLVLALIVVFPYLPGAKSPAFRGISIFLGVLLSLGSSSAVANTIAGVILTYMRSFLPGDWVQIGDNMGEVVERTLLVTRILTPKAEVITIPNSTVMGGAVKNYSTEAKKSGVIFYTSVSISFDAPWRTVHQLLISAALATKHVLRQPAPFVLQRSLDDFYVTYELNAYTNTPREVLNIYSDLHQNIQDKFNEAGLEICSPHFAALRDGNSIATPEQYIAPDYKPSGFRLNLNEAENDDASR
jgi:small-conductance mechanosensitive channel